MVWDLKSLPKMLRAFLGMDRARPRMIPCKSLQGRKPGGKLGIVLSGLSL
ncbi:hypothetical protein MPNT_150027 [Candidatus Methylacidithermus pantelleriae]|uniref:Uncharacterized protein n=1 Tax=Candidatus Methylacidithermus pantelleriae TaxID=2744239 RepID=A0A8J2FRT5_9BACT|nr:hypothetical protein MPNT_150027 [Candidatus Methylacidithermus pantelleriae]